MTQLGHLHVSIRSFGPGLLRPKGAENFLLRKSLPVHGKHASGRLGVLSEPRIWVNVLQDNAALSKMAWDLRHQVGEVLVEALLGAAEKDKG